MQEQTSHLHRNVPFDPTDEMLAAAAPYSYGLTEDRLRTVWMQMHSSAPFIPQSPKVAPVKVQIIVEPFTQEQLEAAVDSWLNTENQPDVKADLCGRMLAAFNAAGVKGVTHVQV